MIYIDFLKSSMHLCKVKSDNCQGWSPTIPRMVNNQPNNGHPLEGSMLQTRNLVLRLNSQNQDQVTTVMDGHLPSLGWSATNPSMVTLYALKDHFSLNENFVLRSTLPRKKLLKKHIALKERCALKQCSTLKEQLALRWGFALEEVLCTKKSNFH